MTSKTVTSTAVILALVLVCGLMASIIRAEPASGASFPGSKATVATTSQSAVGTTAITLFASSTACTSRIVTTYAQPIMLTFSDVTGQTPTGTFGAIQAASTTVTYDAEIYGCDRVKAYSYGSQTITIQENR